MCRLLNSPGYLKFIGDRGIREEQDARQFLVDNIIPDYQKHGFGFYAVEEIERGETIGLCGLTKREGLSHADIGFAFLDDYEGRGFAFEAAKAVLDYAEKQLKLHTVVAIAQPDNQRSIALLNKLGLFEKERIDWKGEELSLLKTRA